MKDGLELKHYFETLGMTTADRQVRLLAMLSAVVALCRRELSEAILFYLRKSDIAVDAIYETIIQSYLFLGFPRAIEALLVFNQVFGDRKNIGIINEVSAQEIRVWSRDGLRLCRQVYGKNYENLRKRFSLISPEIFRWMVIEGYGKVLSRSGLTKIERELAEVAALIVDKRERQLVSHVLGSLNVGADLCLLKKVNNDIRPLAGEEAYDIADKVICSIEEKYDA